MNRFCSPPALVAALLLVMAISGCQKPSSNSEGKKVAAQPAPPTPEESFAVVVESFRRSVEEVPFGFEVRDSSGGRTMMTGRSIVTHKLVPPAKEGEPLKAEIKVETDTQYSLQRSTGTPEPEDGDQSTDSAEEGTSNDADVQIFDPAVASAPSGAQTGTTTSKADPGAATIKRTANKFERTYVLVHENGRWKLITELDPKTEESIKFAFERALASQS